MQDNNLRGRVWGKQGSPQMKQRKRATNKQWFKTESPQIGISKLINFFTKLAYFKQQLGKKILLNWQILSAQQFF